MIKVYHARNLLREKRDQLAESRKGPIIVPIALVLLTAFLVEHRELTMWVHDLVKAIMEAVTGESVIFLPRMAQAAVAIMPVLLAVKMASTYRPPSDEESVLEGGIAGEEYALDLLKSGLQQDATIYTNLQVPKPDRKGTYEVDLIIANNHAVTVVEVKNLRGLISGDLDDYKLRHQNFHKNTEIFNPRRQVRLHQQAVKAFLKNRGIDKPTRRCVLLIHEDCELNLTDNNNVFQYCPVFTLNNDLDAFYSYIEDGDQTLSTATVAKINQLLQRLL